MAPLRAAVFNLPCYADLTLTVCTNCTCTHNVTRTRVCCNELAENTWSVPHVPPPYLAFEKNEFEGCFWQFGLVGIVTLLFAALVIYTLCSLPPRPRLAKSLSLLRPKIHSILKDDNKKAVIEEHRQVTSANKDAAHGRQSTIVAYEPITVSWESLPASTHGILTDLKMISSSDAMLSRHYPTPPQSHASSAVHSASLVKE
ncbi:unnamed protein product [Lymnaea stagnalis]|uniref:Uncharacterized protein n=1 Tax=Lymnaea stagnalis TaxID=6523 RepID=A0AAV2HS34_LYMST